MFFKTFSERVLGIIGRDFLVSIISFIVTTFLANKLGIEVFGLWIGIISLLAILDLVFRLKIDRLIIFYSKENAYNKNLYKKISILSLYGVIVCGIVMIVLSSFIMEFFNLNNTIILLLIYSIFFVSVFGNIIFYIFLAEAKYTSYNFCILGQSITLLSSILMFFYFFDSSIQWALTAQFLSWVFVFIYFTVSRYRGSGNLNFDNNRAFNVTSYDILIKGSYIYSASALKVISDQIPKLFVMNFLGIIPLGHLGLAQIIIGLINRVPQAINTVLYPMLVSSSADELKKTVRIIRMLFLIFIPIIISLEFLMPFFVNVFYGDKFNTTALYVQILLPFVYIGIPGIILSSYFASKGKFNILLTTNFVAIFFSLLSLGIIYTISKDHAAIIAICTSFIGLSVSSIYFIKNSVLLSDFLPSKSDVINLYFFIKRLRAALKKS